MIELPRPLTARIGWPLTLESPYLPDTLPNGLPWPRISVVTPSFNQGSFIEETIRSVLLQGYPNLEYIVMDGGSTDETLEILSKYKFYINHLHVGPDGGQGAAIRAGFERATGEILGWLNSDDMYLPNALIRVAFFFTSHPKHAFVAGDVRLIDERSRPHGILKAVRSQLFLIKNTGGHGWWQPGTFWRREAYQISGGIDPTLSFCMDRDLFIRICSLGRSACIPGMPIAAFRIHQQQKSQTIKEVFYREHELLLSRYGNPRLRKMRPFLGKLWHAWTIINNFRPLSNVEFSRQKD